MKYDIERIEYSITDQCNLNCAYCCHYAPIAKEYYVEELQFYNDISRLAELTYNGRLLGTLGILGGEPLLHPKFIEFCIYARQKLAYSRIRVTTNGLLLNKLNKRDLTMLRRYDIEILISKYRKEDDFNSIEKLLNEYKIIYKFCNNNNFVEFSKFSIDETGSQDIYISHDNCDLWQGKKYYTCHELRDGYLYPCSQIARIDTLNERYNLNVLNKEYSAINIYKNDLETIVKFLKNPVPHCMYCKSKEWQTNSVGQWKKSTKAKEEFI